jgi:hypothetical protein
MSWMLPDLATVSWPANADTREWRPAQPGKSVQWTDLSRERHELERVAGDSGAVVTGLAQFFSSLWCFAPNWVARTPAGHDILGWGLI